MIDSIRTEITTAADGSATASTPPVLNGRLLAVAVILGTAVAVDLVVKDNTGLTLLSQATINASARINPRAALALNTNGSALTVYDAQPVSGPLTYTIANGGNAKTVSVIAFVEV